MRAVATVVLGATMVLAAAAFASPSLYVPGIALTLLALVAAAWVVLAARGASVEWQVGPPTIEEGRPWRFEVRARTGVAPAPGGELHASLLGVPLPMAGRRTRRARVDHVFERRGRHALEPARLAIRDPFGLLERELSAGAGEEVLVLPRVEPVVASAGGAASRAHAAVAARPADAAAEVEMESLRPYREGAPASRIHWPTVARAGTLMERRLLADADSRPLVVLDPTNPAGTAALDMAVRAAASLCVHLARAGGCALVLPGERRATDVERDLAAWPSLHARLALIDPADGAPSVRLQGGRGAVFWVSAGTVARPPRALQRIPGAHCLVLPGRREGAIFTVAGCAGVMLGRTRRAA